MCRLETFLLMRRGEGVDEPLYHISIVYVRWQTSVTSGHRIYAVRYTNCARRDEFRPDVWRCARNISWKRESHIKMLSHLSYGQCDVKATFLRRCVEAMLWSGRTYYIIVGAHVMTCTVGNYRSQFEERIVCLKIVRDVCQICPTCIQAARPRPGRIMILRNVEFNNKSAGIAPCPSRLSRTVPCVASGYCVTQSRSAAPRVHWAVCPSTAWQFFIIELTFE